MSAAEQSEGSGLSSHLRGTMALGMPLVALNVIQMAISVVDTLMIGWLGVQELAAATLAFTVIFISLLFGIGISSAIVPLASAAIGRGDERAVRRAGRMGLWALALVSTAFLIPLSFTREILIAIGQEEALAGMAKRYVDIAMWSLIPTYLHMGLKSFLSSLEKLAAIVWFTILAAILNALLNYALIFGEFGFPRLELEGAAIATLIVNALVLVAVTFYVAKSRHTARFEMFARFWRPDWPDFFKVLRLGIPISFMILAEAGLFSAATIVIGWLGAVPLAAHGIVIQISSLAFMVPQGLAQAAAVRAGLALGRSSPVDIGRAGYAGIILALVFAVCSALVMTLFPGPMIRPFLEDGAKDAILVVTAAIPMMLLAAAFQVVDGLQAVASGVLRGLQDTTVPMIMAFICYWPIGFATGYVLGINFGFGATGIWAGLVAGLTAAAIAMLLRFQLRAKWLNSKMLT